MIIIIIIGILHHLVFKDRQTDRYITNHVACYCALSRYMRVFSILVGCRQRRRARWRPSRIPRASAAARA